MPDSASGSARAGGGGGGGASSSGGRVGALARWLVPRDYWGVPLLPSWRQAHHAQLGAVSAAAGTAAEAPAAVPDEVAPRAAEELRRWQRQQQAAAQAQRRRGQAAAGADAAAGEAGGSVWSWWRWPRAAEVLVSGRKHGAVQGGLRPGCSCGRA